ncbi:hypothetical protein EZV62_008336 [Acer yangbiense]|uniref:Jacalin-type lectin domain-containing protein n=1 Tax=Acer yangbiense TaxID=1000413 RepID=A0A5C7ID33_9ROSI|nr:hypothetical protein EZV62_008336 [Acer yangbiense]
MHELIDIGQWGDTSRGEKWKYETPNTDSSILEIIITYGDVVDSLSFRSTGENVPSPPFGGTTGPESKTITINGSTEYFNSISGTIDTNPAGDIAVQSLTFGTNTGSYGPYPNTKFGTPFNVPLENGEIAGFHGYATEGTGGFINAIGIGARIRSTGVLDPN